MVFAKESFLYFLGTYFAHANSILRDIVIVKKIFFRFRLSNSPTFSFAFTAFSFPFLLVIFQPRQTLPPILPREGKEDERNNKNPCVYCRGGN